MNEQKERRKKGGGSFLGMYLTGKVIGAIAGVIVAAVVIAAVAFGMQSPHSSEQKTTRIGFEDLGELATQAAYCTEVNVTEASRELFGWTIPFTQSKYIYSYDVVVKAGFDFGDIQWNVADGVITVRLPETRILSSELDLDSFQVYHEAESIFRPITLEENNQALADLKQAAEENAVANGLLESARSNAEDILTGFFANAYDLNEYELRFTEH